ncbi:TPA: hypothetical protein HA235_05635 [Candidatus Woesearchaeota archaeon]|nr:hypothetical protein [Candidatus Woesearchaeota archaeon]HIH32163.1 hypothetical protein [Candidatus Woesearchaeota archaeon]HIH55056.1 hypothetical protein [Candidatus Woesearchaeota archaeon]HIJ02478.1 hypothetical protein [Candidatus Woesearchaeota archaeon]HIJ14642.1 hypothetical protein [Candidatus Woesearchaeota archaeon]
MEEFIKSTCKDPKHGDVLENIAMLNVESYLCNPYSNKIHGYIGATLLFKKKHNYDLTIYSINHLPSPTYLYHEDHIQITPGSQCPSSLQELILESGADIYFNNVILPRLEEIKTKEYFEAEKYANDFVTGLKFHYSKIFESLKKETKIIPEREHLIFMSWQNANDFRGAELFRLGVDWYEFNVNAMLVKALDEVFPNK